ncbi:Cdk2 [Trypoxylus dichotomus]
MLEGASGLYKLFNFYFQDCIENMAISGNDISNLCRLCLNKTVEMESIYTPLEDIHEDNVSCLYDVMQKLSWTRLSTDPKYPLYVCLSCVSLLTTAYKVNRLLEASQSQLSILFKEELYDSRGNRGASSGTVEIISDKGKYSLKDILIIEDESQQNSNYEGFLKNLGSVISADFVLKSNPIKRPKEEKFHVVNLVPLISSQKSGNNCTTDIETEDFNKNSSNAKEHNENNLSRLKCNICNKKFTSVGNLHRHKDTHVGKKSYLCQESDSFVIFVERSIYQIVIYDIIC